MLRCAALCHAERERLLEEGFSNWTRREFNAFVRACEKYGRAAVADVAREIEGKTEDEVCVRVCVRGLGC